MEFVRYAEEDPGGDGEDDLIFGGDSESPDEPESQQASETGIFQEVAQFVDPGK
jgi:hypothetical protein